MAAYEWKMSGLFNVDANDAGAELERIYEKHGSIEPAQVVEESRPKKAPLHSCFEWDDATAAEKYREQQARCIIANVMVVGQPESDTFTRAFVHVEQKYQPLYVVLESADKTAELLQTAMRELRTFEAKYRELSQLTPVFQAITEITKED